MMAWATAEMMSSPPAPPITSFDPWALLIKMEGTMEDGDRSPGTGGQHPPGAPLTLSPFTGEGVVPEPRGHRSHKSRSSLLRMMPVRGEYTIAPKLQPWRQSLGSHQTPPALPTLQDPLTLQLPRSMLEPLFSPWHHPGGVPKDPPVPPYQGTLLSEAAHSQVSLGSGPPQQQPFSQRCQGWGPLLN